MHNLYKKVKYFRNVQFRKSKSTITTHRISDNFLHETLDFKCTFLTYVFSSNLT